MDFDGPCAGRPACPVHMSIERNRKQMTRIMEVSSEEGDEEDPEEVEGPEEKVEEGAEEDILATDNL